MATLRIPACSLVMNWGIWLGSVMEPGGMGQSARLVGVQGKAAGGEAAEVRALKELGGRLEIRVRRRSGGGCGEAALSELWQLVDGVCSCHVPM